MLSEATSDISMLWHTTCTQRFTQRWGGSFCILHSANTYINIIYTCHIFKIQAFVSSSIVLFRDRWNPVRRLETKPRTVAWPHVGMEGNNFSKFNACYDSITKFIPRISASAAPGCARTPVSEISHMSLKKLRPNVLDMCEVPSMLHQQSVNSSSIGCLHNMRCLS